MCDREVALEAPVASLAR